MAGKDGSKAVVQAGKACVCCARTVKLVMLYHPAAKLGIFATGLQASVTGPLPPSLRESHLALNVRCSPGWGYLLGWL